MPPPLFSTTPVGAAQLQVGKTSQLRRLITLPVCSLMGNTSKKVYAQLSTLGTAAGGVMMRHKRNFGSHASFWHGLYKSQVRVRKRISVGKINQNEPSRSSCSQHLRGHDACSRATVQNNWRGYLCASLDQSIELAAAEDLSIRWLHQFQSVGVRRAGFLL